MAKDVHPVAPARVPIGCHVVFVHLEHNQANYLTGLCLLKCLLEIVHNVLTSGGKNLSGADAGPQLDDLRLLWRCFRRCGVVVHLTLLGLKGRPRVSVYAQKMSWVIACIE